MRDDLPVSIWRGELDVAGVTLVCHVLDNGERIIEGEGLAKLFEGEVVGMLSGEDADKLTAFIKGSGVPE